MMYYLNRAKNLLLIAVWKIIYFCKFLPFRLTYRHRKLPSFIIIGTPKSGTTYLHDLLSQHPQLVPSRIKEPHYFDQHYRKGETYYKAMFPKTSDQRMAYEASVNYFYSAHAAKRIKHDLPNCKIILLLRDPVERTFSHFHMNKKDLKTKSFSELIEAENFENKRYGFVEKSKYSLYLPIWNELFSAEEFLILKSIDLFNEPEPLLRRITQFLVIENHDFKTGFVSNKGHYETIDPHSKATLKLKLKEEYQLLESL